MKLPRAVLKADQRTLEPFFLQKAVDRPKTELPHVSRALKMFLVGLTLVLGLALVGWVVFALLLGWLTR